MRLNVCRRGLDILIGILTDPSRDPVQLREAAGERSRITAHPLPVASLHHLCS